MKKYYFEIGDRRAKRFMILNENLRRLFATDEESDVAGLTEVHKKSNPIVEGHDGNTDLGDFVILGPINRERIMRMVFSEKKRGF